MRKKMFKGLSVVLCIAMMVSLLAGCGSGRAATEANPDTAAKQDEGTTPTVVDGQFNLDEVNNLYIQLAHSNAESEVDQFHALGRFFKQHAEELSGGKITVDVMGGAQLGTEPDYMEGMKMGTIDMAIVTGFNIGPFYEPYTVFDLPFLFYSRDEAHAVFEDKELMAPILDGIYQECGVKVIGIGDSGFRNVVGNKGPVENVDDMKGYKIRVPGNELYSKTFLLLGANPLTISSSEKFTAVSQGTVDGLELPLGSIVSEGFHEISKYFSYTEHMYQTLNLCVSGQIWETLNDTEKALLEEAARLAVQDEYEFIANIEAKYVSTLEEAGVQISSVDKEEFAAAVAPLYEDAASNIGQELIDSIEAKLATLR